jgi:hypothetical protein
VQVANIGTSWLRALQNQVIVVSLVTAPQLRSPIVGIWLPLHCLNLPSPLVSTVPDGDGDHRSLSLFPTPAFKPQSEPNFCFTASH